MKLPIIIGSVGFIQTKETKDITVPISGKNMCKLFLQAGYVIVSGGKGSHIKLKKKNCPTVIVPNHKELSKGLEHALRKLLEEVK